MNDFAPEYAILSRSPDGTILSWNSGAEELYGYAAAEAIGRPISLITPPELRPSLPELLRREQNDDLVQPGAMVRLHKDGRRLDVVVSVTPVRPPAGSAAAPLLAALDVSARTKPAAEQRARDEKWRTLFEILPVGVSIIDAHSAIVDMNTALQSILRISADSLKSGAYRARRYLRRDGTPMPAAEFPSARALTEQRSIADVEMCVVTEDDTRIWMNISAAPLPFSDARVVIVITDITARRQAELAILQQNADLTALSRMSNALSRLADSGDLPGLIQATVRQVLHTENITLFLYDEPNRQLSYALFPAVGWPASMPPRPLGNGLADYVVRSRATLYLPRDVQKAAAALGIEHLGPAVACFLGVPMMSGEHVLGVIALYDLTREDAYDEWHREVLSLLASQAAIALQNARLFAETQSLAHTDALTGVANRLQLFNVVTNELSRARRFKHPLSVLLLDIDDFKRVNDTLGHAAGDEVLRAVARICLEHVRATDLVARYGGEEFVILLTETHLAGARISAERLRERVAASVVTTARGACQVTISVGVASTLPDEHDFDRLMIRADEALYVAKKGGRNRVVLATESA